MFHVQIIRNDHGAISNEQAVKELKTVISKLEVGITDESRTEIDDTQVSFWDNPNEI